MPKRIGWVPMRPHTPTRPPAGTAGECPADLMWVRSEEERFARTEEHFWNPEDADYVDFATPFATDEETIVPTWFVLESNTAVWDRLDEGQRIKLTNESARWSLSNILHGEQGALSLSASLCDIFLDPGAQEYAANQAREEARHVH